MGSNSCDTAKPTTRGAAAQRFNVLLIRVADCHFKYSPILVLAVRTNPLEQPGKGRSTVRVALCGCDTPFPQQAPRVQYVQVSLRGELYD